MEFREKIDLLVSDFGVKKEWIYTEMGMSNATFMRKMRGDSEFREHQIRLFDIKWGALFNSED